MDKRLREISRFFVAPPRVFPLSVRARSCASTDLFIHKFLHLSINVRTATQCKQEEKCSYARFTLLQCLCASAKSHIMSTSLPLSGHQICCISRLIKCDREPLPRTKPCMSNNVKEACGKGIKFYDWSYDYSLSVTVCLNNS